MKPLSNIIPRFPWKMQVNWERISGKNTKISQIFNVTCKTHAQNCQINPLETVKPDGFFPDNAQKFVLLFSCVPTFPETGIHIHGDI